MRFLRLFHLYIWRDVTRHPLRSLLTVFGIALGVGVVVAVQLANDRALDSLNENVRILSGKADLHIGANGLPLDETLIKDLSWIWDIGSMSPVVEGRGRLPASGAEAGSGDAVYMFGVDFLSESAFREYIGEDDRNIVLDISRSEFIDILVDPALVVIPDALAGRAGVAKGSPLHLQIGDAQKTFTVGAVLQDRGAGLAFAGNVVFMDIAAAQLALGKLGRLDRIDILLDDDSQVEKVQSRLAAQLPANAVVYRPDAGLGQNEKLLRAFRYNLTALSYIALIVGVTLVHNTMMIAVIRRRPEIGALRALGTPGRTIGAMFLLEASALGLLGSLGGVVVGFLLSHVSGALISETVTSLYSGLFSLSAAPAVETGRLVRAALGGTLLAAISGTAPAWRATRVSPASVLREGFGSSPPGRSRNTAIPAAALAALAALLSLMPPIGDFPFLGYAAAVCLIASAGLATPGIARMLLALIAGRIQRIAPVAGTLAMQSMRSGIRRITVAVFSLSIAVAMLVSVATMVASFRNTVIAWVNQTMRADLYIRPAASGSNEWDSTFDPSSVDRLAGLPSIAAIDRFRGRQMNVSGATVVVAGGEFSVLRDRGHLLFADGRTMQEVADRMPREDRIIVSEPFAIKQRIRKGDFVSLPTAAGNIRFQVEAIFYDYSNDRGLLVMDRTTFVERFRDPAVTNVALYLQPGTNPAAARAEIAALLPESRLRILTNAELREQVLRVFDQTFQITFALEAIAIIVAVLGIANTLAALILERRVEFAVLRFLGTNRRRLRQIVLSESAITGIIGIACGLLLGLLLSLLLVYVINRQSFGWTIQFGIPGWFLLQSLAAVFVATVAAGLYPGRLVWRLNPIQSVRAG